MGGLGGGGTADGVGGSGTKGSGRGSSGYGKGGSSVGKNALVVLSSLAELRSSWVLWTNH